VDATLLRRPALPLGRRREPAFAQDLRRSGGVALGLDEGALRVHHPGARRLAQGLHLHGADVAHPGRSVLVCISAAPVSTTTSSGSQLVSTIAITGIPSLRASPTAMCSFFVSTTNTASGRRSRAWMPPRFRSSFSRSRRLRIASFFGR